MKKNIWEINENLVNKDNFGQIIEETKDMINKLDEEQNKGGEK